MLQQPQAMRCSPRNLKQLSDDTAIDIQELENLDQELSDTELDDVGSDLDLILNDI